MSEVAAEVLENRRAASRRWKRRHYDDPIYRASTRRSTKKHWEKSGRNSTYLYKYGITADEFDAMVVAQNNRCLIGNHEFAPRGRSATSPVLDHNHQTGEVRGAICRLHNAVLGYVHDSIEELESCIAYLKKSEREKSNE